MTGSNAGDVRHTPSPKPALQHSCTFRPSAEPQHQGQSPPPRPLSEMVPSVSSHRHQQGTRPVCAQPAGLSVSPSPQTAVLPTPLYPGARGWQWGSPAVTLGTKPGWVTTEGEQSQLPWEPCTELALSRWLSWGSPKVLSSFPGRGARQILCSSPKADCPGEERRLRSPGII